MPEEKKLITMLMIQVNIYIFDNYSTFRDLIYILCVFIVIYILYAF